MSRHMPGDDAKTLLISSMKTTDLAEVLVIERAFFSVPWTESIFRQELALSQARNIIARCRNEDLAGYLNYWLVIDEIQLHKIAVRQDWQHHGVASALMKAMSERARQEGARYATLEVGISNEPAKNLYERFGFEVRGIRPLYYDDPHEDALIMWVELGKTEHGL